MKNKVTGIVCSIVVMLLGFQQVSNSQAVESFIEMAKENNPGLRAIKLEYESARHKAEQVSYFPDPKLSLGLGVLPIETRLGAQLFRLGFSQSIPWKGHLNARTEEAIAKADVQSNLDKVREKDIEYAIRSSYTSLILLNEKEKILNRKTDVLEAMEEFANSVVRSGNGKLSSLILVRRNQEAVTTEIAILKKQKEQPTIMINRWAGRQLKDTILVQNDQEMLYDNEELLSFAKTRYPQLTVLDNQIEASKKSIELTNYEAKPKIGVGLDYSWISSRNDIEIPRNGRDVLMPSATISIPINKGRFKAKRQEEILKQKAIHAQKEDLSDMYTSEITGAISKIELAHLTINHQESLKALTKETIELKRFEAASEGGDFDELLRLEMELIDYDLQILTALYEKALAFATLNKYKN